MGRVLPGVVVSCVLMSAKAMVCLLCFLGRGLARFLRERDFFLLETDLTQRWKQTVTQDWVDHSDLYMGECDGLDGGLAAGKRTCMPS